MNIPRPGTFEADGGEIIALQGQKSANLEIGDVAEIHRNLLQDRGHRQPRLLNAGLHQPGPAPIRRQRLGLGIVRQFGAKGQEKRLRQQEKARAGAAVHAERKPRRRRLAIPTPKREGILDRRQPLEAQRDASDGSEGRLERLPQCAGERFEKRRLDRRARPLGFASSFVGTIGADGFAENRGDNQAVDALIERDHELCFGFGARIDRRGQAGALANRLKQRGCANLFDCGAGRARDERSEARRRLRDEAIERVS